MSFTNTMFLKRIVSTSIGSLSIRMLHKTHYEVLGLKKNCTTKDVKSAYITLSKKFHPDNNSKEASHKDFLRISEAYNILSKPDKRRLYDWEIEQPVYQRATYPRHRPRPPPRAPRAPFEDEFIWRHREYHHSYGDDYYGVPGMKRVSNGIIAVICVFLTIVCAGVQFYAIRHAYSLRQELFQQRSKENEEILSRLSSRVHQMDRNTQINIVDERLKSSDSRFP